MDANKKLDEAIDLWRDLFVKIYEIGFINGQKKILKDANKVLSREQKQKIKELMDSYIVKEERKV